MGVIRLCHSLEIFKTEPSGTSNLSIVFCQCLGAARSTVEIHGNLSETLLLHEAVERKATRDLLVLRIRSEAVLTTLSGKLAFQDLELSVPKESRHSEYDDNPRRRDVIFYI